jgi:hypothetical protein
MPYYRVTHGRGYNYPTTKPNWTFILIAANVLVFIIGFFTPVLDSFAFVPALAFQKPWTFITSIFLHADFMHIFANMFALFIFGMQLESRIGYKNFLIIFFLAGIVGNIGYMLTAPSSLTPGVGASGAINGVVGTLVILMPFLMFYVYGLIPMPLILLSIMWALIDFFGLFAPSGIAHGAHLGGLFVGLIFGFYLKYSSKKLKFF